MRDTDTFGSVVAYGKCIFCPRGSYACWWHGHRGEFVKIWPGIYRSGLTNETSGEILTSGSVNREVG